MVYWRGMPTLDAEPTVPQLLSYVTRRFGERRLISLGDQRITYAEAGVESARLARGLLARGVGKGTRVGLLFPNGPDWVICWLAAARIGALVVPINTFYKARELGWTLQHRIKTFFPSRAGKSPPSFTSGTRQGRFGIRWKATLYVCPLDAWKYVPTR